MYRVAATRLGLAHAEPRPSHLSSPRPDPRRLLHDKNIMVSRMAKNRASATAKYLSILNVIQGEVEPSQVHRSLERIR